MFRKSPFSEEVDWKLVAIVIRGSGACFSLPILGLLVPGSSGYGSTDFKDGIEDCGGFGGRPATVMSQVPSGESPCRGGDGEIKGSSDCSCILLLSNLAGFLNLKRFFSATKLAHKPALWLYKVHLHVNHE